MNSLQDIYSNLHSQIERLGNAEFAKSQGYEGGGRKQVKLLIGLLAKAKTFRKTDAHDFGLVIADGLGADSVVFKNFQNFTTCYPKSVEA